MANKNLIAVELRSLESSYKYHRMVSKKWFLANKGKEIKKYDRNLNKHVLFKLGKQGK